MPQSSTRNILSACPSLNGSWSRVVISARQVPVPVQIMVSLSLRSFHAGTLKIAKQKSSPMAWTGDPLPSSALEYRALSRKTIE